MSSVGNVVRARHRSYNANDVELPRAQDRVPELFAAAATVPVEPSPVGKNQRQRFDTQSVSGGPVCTQVRAIVVGQQGFSSVDQPWSDLISDDIRVYGQFNGIITSSNGAVTVADIKDFVQVYNMLCIDDSISALATVTALLSKRDRGFFKVLARMRPNANYSENWRTRGMFMRLAGYLGFETKRANLPTVIEHLRCNQLLGYMCTVPQGKHNVVRQQSQQRRRTNGCVTTQQSQQRRRTNGCVTTQQSQQSQQSLPEWVPGTLYPYQQLTEEKMVKAAQRKADELGKKD